MMSLYLSPREVHAWEHGYTQTCGVQVIYLRGIGIVAIRPNDNIRPPTNGSFEISVVIHETPRSVTFALPNGLLKDHPVIDGDGDFEYIQGHEAKHIKDKLFNMRVKGNGTLSIESIGGVGSQNFKIKLRINCDEFVLLALPQEFNGNFDICGDGNIQFTTHFEDELSSSTDKNQMEKFTAAIETESKENVLERARNHGHRRNGSDYLQITGGNEHISCESDLQEEAGSIKCYNEQNGECLCEDENNETTANVGTGSNSNVVSREGTRRVKYKDCKCDVLDRMSQKEQERDFEHTKGYNGFRKSVIRSNDRRPWYTGACLKCAIRYYYNLLLHSLMLPEFCDHLYEKGIICIEYYRDLIKRCEQNRVLEAKRSVLVHLSTRNICHDDFLQVLYDSSMYRLVPKFYPGVKI